MYACTGPDGKTPSPPAEAPCTAGTWSGVTEEMAATAVHVRADGSDDGTGSADAPFATFAAAMAGDPALVLVGPGTFDALVIDADATVIGCGAESVLTSEGPVVWVDSAVATVSGLAISGGDPGVWAWQAADLTLADAQVEGATGPGLVIEGAQTHATLTSVGVNGAGDIGFSVQDATVDATDVTITGATGLGLLVDGLDANLTATGLTLSAMVADAAGEGRGIQVQHYANATLADVQVSDAIGAGIVGLQAVTLDLQSTTISGTTAGTGLGDGLVVLDGDVDESWDQSYFDVTAQGLVVDGAARAGVLLSGNGLLGRLLSATITADYDPGPGMPLIQGGPELSNDTVPTYDLDTSGESLSVDATAHPLVYVEP